MQQAREAELQVVYEGRAVAFEEITWPAAEAAPQSRNNERFRRRSKPAADHPWRKSLRSKKRAATT